MSRNPFSIGLRAARANVAPGLIIQALMAALVLAYYFVPASLSFYQTLAAAKAHWGYGFSYISAVIAGAVLPVAFKILLLQRGRAERANLAEFLFLAAFWGTDGIIVDAFYRFQAILFGTRVDVATVAKKVLMDQFLYTPFFSVPYTLAWYEWRRQGYRLSRIGHAFTAQFFRTNSIPAICAAWSVWIPLTSAIYALPSLLQIPLFALALTFWVLMLTYITSRNQSAKVDPRAIPEPAGD